MSRHRSNLHRYIREIPIFYGLLTACIAECAC